MNTLLATQTRFQDYLLDPAGQSLDGLVADGGGASCATRMNIYVNAYRVRLVEAAATDYAQLCTYLGDEAFAALIHAYLARHPSRQPTLREFGAHLPGFLRRTHPYREHRDLYELAKFEWALCDAFDAPDAEPLAEEVLATLPPQRWLAIAPRFHPSLQRLRLNGNLPGIWQALNDGNPPPAPAFRRSPRNWLIWRHALRLLFRPATPDEARCLYWFMSGATFADVCQRLSQRRSGQDVPRLIAGLFRQWLADGLLTGI